MSPEVSKPHIECAGGCPPLHKAAKRISVSLIAILLVLLALSITYIFLLGGNQ